VRRTPARNGLRGGGASRSESCSAWEVSTDRTASEASSRPPARCSLCQAKKLGAVTSFCANPGTGQEGRLRDGPRFFGEAGQHHQEHVQGAMQVGRRKRLVNEPARRAARRVDRGSPRSRPADRAPDRPCRCGSRRCSRPARADAPRPAAGRRGCPRPTAARPRPLARRHRAPAAPRRGRAAGSRS
jgi:hypothetical protein